MHYLITGHTGFKGSWLSLMLKNQGHEVSGVSLNPDKTSLFNQALLKDLFKYDYRLDIRDEKKLKKAFQRISPDVVIHLAAQPLVRQSYLNPVETYDTNVIGTLNVLESIKKLANLRTALVITTDKVYKNLESFDPYDENSPLGGDDPYSSSKAAADLLTQSWTKSFASFPIGIARAGNVIGGGDWAQDRLIPDLIKSTQVGSSLKIRNPKSIRPWQHVFDCLNGYLKLIDFQLETGISGCWNFGPEVSSDKTVERVIEEFSRNWEESIKWHIAEDPELHEAGILLLNSEKARSTLNWKDRLMFEESIAWTTDWYKQAKSGKNPRAISIDQIINFFKLN